MTLFKGWRTVIVNAIMAAPIAWDVAWAVVQTSEFRALVPVEWLPYYSLGMVVVNMWLRKITNTALGRKS